MARVRGTSADLARFGLRAGAAFAVLHVDRASGAERREEFLRAATYWRARGLPVEAVIVAADSQAARGAGDAMFTSSSRDELSAANLISSTRPRVGSWAMRISTCRRARARRLASGHDGSTPRPARRCPCGRAEAQAETLELFNGFGGFAEQGREYVIRQRPPRPWINVVANERFGFLVSETGAGYTWSGNSREHRLTPWYNDPVFDPHGEALYVRDEDSGAFWSPLPGPAPGSGRYEMRHGFGYSRCSYAGDGLEHETTLFVPRRDPVKVARVRVSNRGDRPRRLSFFAYSRLVLGVMPQDGASVIVSPADDVPNTLFARNPLAGDFAGRVAFAAVVPAGAARGAAFTADRASFLGRNGSLANPAALRTRDALNGRAGHGTDPCFAHQVLVDVQAGATVEVAFLLGDADGEGEARTLVARYSAPGAIDAALGEVREFWTRGLGGVRIETPSRSLDLLVNGWLPYQTLACRLWGRSAFYQSGGAFGFRDQLQDAAALSWLWPELTREQILRNAAHQFVEGDVLHWWHPPASRGLRTRFADDLLWLPAVTAQYVAATGDRAILTESVRYLRAPALEPDEDETYLQPQDVGDAGDVYDHCCRAIERSLRAARTVCRSSAPATGTTG
jgi:cyclic beta-1,2-glucan synthetase